MSNRKLSDDIADQLARIAHAHGTDNGAYRQAKGWHSRAAALEASLAKMVRAEKERREKQAARDAYLDSMPMGGAPHYD